MEVHPIADKPILTIEGKRSFLEYCLELADGKPFKSFLNLLLTSKEFLNVSKYYPIYCMDSINASPDFNNFSVMFMNTGMFKIASHDFVDIPYVSSKRFNLSPEKSCSIVSLLKPAYFLLTLVDSNFSEKALKNCADVFNRVPGKVGVISCEFLDGAFISLMNQFAAKINCMFMTELLLLNDDLVVFPKLESCRIEKVINIGQLDNVLRHKIKELSIEIDNEFLNEGEGSPVPASKRLKLDKCESLKKLFITMPEFREDLILPLLDQVTARCPKLQKVHVYVPSEFKEKWLHIHFAETDDIVRRLLDHYSAVKKFVDGCKKFKFELVIWSTLNYRFEGEYDCDWIETIEENENFKDLTHFDSSDPYEKLHKCIVKYSGEDQLLNFKQEVQIVYVNPDFEGEDSDYQHSEDEE